MNISELKAVVFDVLERCEEYQEIRDRLSSMLMQKQFVRVMQNYERWLKEWQSKSDKGGVSTMTISNMKAFAKIAVALFSIVTEVSEVVKKAAKVRK
ncbi:MAG: hypothetical protein FWG57_09115 [Endomicrobia bacterium]|nr:hypothetical protein [Endomicrobiia bacterium]